MCKRYYMSVSRFRVVCVSSVFEGRGLVVVIRKGETGRHTCFDHSGVMRRAPTKNTANQAGSC